VIPNVVKGAFLAGGRFGKGLVAARGENGEWGTPLFVDIAGGSFGLQIGVEATDLILVFTEPNGLREMLKDNLKLGAEAGAVAGPVGRQVEAGTNLTFDSPIYSYSRNKGVFAGVSLDGSLLSVDDSSNQEAYGEKGSGNDILVARKVPETRLPSLRHGLEENTPAHERMFLSSPSTVGNIRRGRLNRSRFEPAFSRWLLFRGFDRPATGLRLKQP
jgi:lipid-binding SYLF domain-containing protein